MSADKRTAEFSVYVIQFEADWIDDKGKGTVYVGYTARTPEQRLEAHRAGGATAAAIFKINRRRRANELRLRPDLAQAKPGHAGPWATDKEAMTHERRLANLLKAHGCIVEVGRSTAARNAYAEPITRTCPCARVTAVYSVSRVPEGKVSRPQFRHVGFLGNVLTAAGANE